jgi:hypothetical protein
MKVFIYFTLIVAIGLLAACKKDFLQRDISVLVDEEKTFNDPILAFGFANNTYTFLINDYARLNVGPSVAVPWKGMTGQFADESISNVGESSVQVFNSGNYLSPNATDVVFIYGQMYKGIRNANTMLAKVDDVPWIEPYNASYIKGEQHFLRAYFYFELLKRFGGVVLLTKPQPITEAAIDLSRASYDETLALILSDLEVAISLLPVKYVADDGDHEPNNFYGRATIGAARALKSRALLHAASSQNNPSGDATKWRLAADAAADVMAMQFYGLEDNYNDVLILPASKEYIMIKPRAPRRMETYIKDFIAPVSYFGTQSTISPTQNHVDLYEMQATGLPIGDPLSGYQQDNPYLGRDPRFYTNILAHDMTWQGRKVDVSTGGRDNPNDDISTQTGYYIKRLWPEAVNGNIPQTSGTLNFVHFRYAEILLNFAEAKNEELAAPSSEVYDAVNAVRQRAGMPKLENLDKVQMRNRIRNERAVEFAFEEMRWWDVLRWKAGAEIATQTFNRMQITKSGNTVTYQVLPLAERYQRPAFQPHWHLYPIPLAEIQKTSGALKQNPGWGN